MHTVEIAGVLTGGRTMEVEDEIPIEPFEGIVFEKPARVDVHLRYAQGWLEVRGAVTAEGLGACDVCLRPVSLPVRADVDERLDPNLGRQADPFGESNVLVGSRFDVADLARQVLLSTLPMGVRCEHHALQ